VTVSQAFVQASLRPSLVAQTQPGSGRVAAAEMGLYERRDLIALVVASLIVASMTYAMNTISMQRAMPQPSPVVVSLVELPIPPPPEPEPEPVEPPPRAQPQPPVPQPPVPQIETVPPLPTPAPAPVVEVPPPVPKPMVQPFPQPAPAAPVQRSNPAAEGAYQAKARSMVERNKNYPDDALQMGMTGSVVLVYVIDRDGRLVRAEIERSSGHSLLDQAALRAVRRARFEPMPEDAWIGLREQIFRTRIDFNLE
jgi:protein TonB